MSASDQAEIVALRSQRLADKLRRGEDTRQEERDLTTAMGKLRDEIDQARRQNRQPS